MEKVSGRLLVTDSTQAGSAVEKVIVVSPGGNAKGPYRSGRRFVLTKEIDRSGTCSSATCNVTVRGLTDAISKSRVARNVREVGLLSVRSAEPEAQRQVRCPRRSESHQP